MLAVAAWVLAGAFCVPGNRSGSYRGPESGRTGNAANGSKRGGAFAAAGGNGHRVENVTMEFRRAEDESRSLKELVVRLRCADSTGTRRSGRWTR